ncbi:unnamed protein product, partial [Laminaria digitata]
WGLAALELSTGELRATGAKGADLLVDEVSRLGLRELLVLESARDDARISAVAEAMPDVTLSFVDDAAQDMASVQATLTRVLGEQEVRGARTALEEDAIYAAGLCLRYAEDAQIRPEAPDLKGEASLAHVQSLTPFVAGHALILDAQAREHLELFAAQGQGGRQGSLLEAIDEAKTTMGARLLAQWLAYPLRDVQQIELRQGVVQALQQSPSAQDCLRDGLAQVSDVQRLVGRVVMGRANPRDLVALKEGLQAAPEILSA